MVDMAFTAIWAKEPDASGRYWTLGVAERGTPGYTPVKETGTPADPLYVAKFPTRFSTKKEADAEAAKLNKEWFNIDEREAFLIVASSIGAQNQSEAMVHRVARRMLNG